MLALHDLKPSDSGCFGRSLAGDRWRIWMVGNKQDVFSNVYNNENAQAFE